MWKNVKKLNRIALLAKRELARRHMADFVQYVDDRYCMNWHHRLLCDYLDRFVAGGIKNLMVFMPPRHGKSELVSRKLPAYIFGRDPDASIISCSYSADLAGRMNRDVQRIIDSPSYAELFPATRLFGKNVRSVANGTFLRNSDIFEIVDHRGVYRSTGVGGGITGMGGQYIIIDDPVKNREDADSPTMRNKLWDWYTSTLYTRLEKDGRILVTLTRWHEDDLAGRLLAKSQEPGEDNIDWTILNLPAVCEGDAKQPYDMRQDGEALWRGTFDERALRRIKVAVGSRDWLAMYQQRPTSSAGDVFKRAWWQYWKALPSRMSEYIQSWDCTFKNINTADYVVGQVWAKKGADRYLLDQVRGRMTFTETLNAIRSLSAKWPQATRKLVEDKANGTAVMDVLKHEIPGLIPVTPVGGKVSRAYAVTAVIESGNVYVPHPTIAPWVHDFVEEHAAFPTGTHDDQVDATTQAHAYYNAHTFNLKALIT